MRLRREVIDRLAGSIARELIRYRYIETGMTEAELSLRVAGVIAEDLRIEDKLNQEVRDLLANYESEMDRRNVEYSRMFDLVKRRLVRERNLIL